MTEEAAKQVLEYAAAREFRQHAKTCASCIAGWACDAGRRLLLEAQNKAIEEGAEVHGTTI